MKANSIAATLFGKTRLAVLSLLLVDHTKRFYLNQIIQRTKLGVGAVQRELTLLTDCGILIRTPEGRQVYFQANQNCPIYAELRSLIVKTGGIADVLKGSLSRLSKKLYVAFIYGSMAAGNDDAASDIDLMVIGNISFEQVNHALSDVQETLRREVNPTVYPPEEFLAKSKTPFIKSVLSKPKIFLIGAADDLNRLAE